MEKVCSNPIKIFFKRLGFNFTFDLKGIEPTGNLVDAPTKFNVETFTAGHGDVEVAVINPKGQKEPVIFLYILTKSSATKRNLFVRQENLNYKYQILILFVKLANNLFKTHKILFFLSLVLK